MKKIVGAVFLVFVFAVWYRLSQAPQSDSEFLGLAPNTGRIMVAKRGQSDWQGPIGAYDLTVALDRSGSITDADRAIGRTMVDSVAVRVLGRNRLQIAEFANTFETFGQAEGEEGINELLGRWRRSKQYSEDRRYTNITMTLCNLLQRVVPVVKQGYLAEIIVVTDGDHDPPPGQDDVQYQSGIDDALQKVDYEHSDRLRIHIIEVGAKFAYRGKVATEFLQGRATTLQASSWQAALPIVEKLQSALQGSFLLASAPAAELRIPVPGDHPEELGPFTLKLTGVASAKFRVRLQPEDATIGDRVTGFLKTNKGRLMAFDDSSLELKADDRIVFVLKIDPNRPLESGWKKYFSRRLWQGKDWTFTISLEPRDNILPLEDLGGSREFTIYTNSLLGDYGLAAVLGLALAGSVLLSILIIILCRSSDREAAQEEVATAAADIREHGLFGVVEYNEEQTPLAGREQEVDDCLLFSRAPSGIHLMPYTTFVMTVGHKPPEIYYPDVVYVLPEADEVVLTEKQTGQVYKLMLHPTALHFTPYQKEVAVG